MPDPKDDDPSAEILEPLLKGPLVVEPGHPNTIVVPGDPPSDDPAQAPPPSSGLKQEELQVNAPSGVVRWIGTTVPIVFGNEVELFVGEPDINDASKAAGFKLYEAMRKDILTATSPEHFIHLLGWWCTMTVELKRGDPTSTLQNLLLAAAARKVELRSMLWEQPDLPRLVARAALVVGPILMATFGPVIGAILLANLMPILVFILVAAPPGQNVLEVSFIDGLPTGAAVLDDRTLFAGSHHQKILIVNGTSDLVAYVGGCDINPDRVFPTGAGGSKTGGSPLHDTHLRVRGPAAQELANIVVERWTRHPEALKKPPPKNAITAPPSQSMVGKKVCGLGRTYGAGSPFTAGVTTAEAMIMNAIDQAQQYIYIEDQYFVGMLSRPATAASIATKLADALRRIEFLIVVLADEPIVGDLPFLGWARRRFIQFLRKADPRANQPNSKFRVYNRIKSNPTADPRTYVHSKLYIFDDEYAIVGSANCSERSATHDSEVMLGVYDDPPPAPTLRFAHELRVKLWAMMLDEPESTVLRPLAAAPLFDRSTNTKIEKYDENRGIDPGKTFCNPNFNPDKVKMVLPLPVLPPPLPPVMVDVGPPVALALRALWDRVIDPAG